MSQPLIIDAHELSKDYGDSPALAPLTLRLTAGERVALVGHNGSGKSTLLKMFAGMLSPTDGTVSIAGHAVGSIEARRARSYLADTPSFYDDLSVREHLEYVSRMHGVEDWQAVGEDLLDHLGLTERGDDLPSTFSRGLRQKAAIAIAFIRPFELLLVDEPFVGLDAHGREALVELFDQVAAAGATLVVATHELSFADRTTRMIGLRDGEVIHDGEANAGLARTLLE
jgi:ABC-2 type transport system ATP-binding protein